MKVLVAEKIAEEGIQYLQKNGLEVDVKTSLSREALLSCVGDYDAIIVRSVTKVNEEFYTHASKLKVVGRAGNGVDNIEMAGATARGIIVVNTPDANTVSAAELTIGLMLALCRNIPGANAHTKSRQWDRSQFKGMELRGKTLGVVGLGRIGTMVAKRMQSFEMDVIAYDPYIQISCFEKAGVEKVATLNELIKRSDIVTVHTPKTKETLGMIGKEQFEICKKDLRIINCARGGIIDEEALYNAMQVGKVAGAAIDVLVGEPNPSSPLLDMDNTVLTPHLGASTLEAQKNVGESVAIEVLEALKGKLVANAVNLPALKSYELEALTPYLHLSESVGKLYHQIHQEGITEIALHYKGDIAKFDTTTLTLAFLKGLYENVLDDAVNYVNARLVAEKRGVSIIEGTETENKSYTSSIKCIINTAKGSHTFEGALFNSHETRIVGLDDYSFDVKPQKHMLLIENSDKPGMIGKIGGKLGEENVNIATMNVSLSAKNPHAMMLLTVDAPVSKESLKAIKSIEGIHGAWALEM